MGGIGKSRGVEKGALDGGRSCRKGKEKSVPSINPSGKKGSEKKWLWSVMGKEQSDVRIAENEARKGKKSNSCLNK